MSYKEQIDLNRIPKHVAIIMDGNGRWAKLRGHERSFGHQAGAETVHIITEEAARLGIKFLTLFYRKLEPAFGRSRCIDEPPFRLYRRGNIYEKQYQFPYHRRHQQTT